MSADVMLVVLTNGRKDYIDQTIPSAEKSLVTKGNTRISHRVIVDDSGDATYRQWLRERFPDYELHTVGDEPLGLWNALTYIRGWVRHCKPDYVFHLEDDFLFNAPVVLDDLVAIQRTDPSHIAQVALLRQAWYQNEKLCGGLMEALEAQHPHQTLFIEQYTSAGIPYLMHRTQFTLNPCLYPLWITDYQWPKGDWTEAYFGKQLLRDQSIICTYYGQRHDPPLVTHIGVERVGIQY